MDGSGAGCVVVGSHADSVGAVSDRVGAMTVSEHAIVDATRAGSPPVRVGDGAGGKVEEEVAPRRIRRRVWMVRHGEREDEADRVGFYEKVEAEEARWWDPNLTERGAQQALIAGDNLRALLDERAASGDIGAAKVDMVFASPLHRTVKTAEQVAIALGLPLSTVAGLSECALAMRGKDLTKFEFLTHEELQAANSLVDYREEVRVSEQFYPTVCRLAAEHPGDGDIIIVTHREGIRRLAATRVSTPYCVQAEFEVDLQPEEPVFDLVNLYQIPKAMSTRACSKAGSKGRGSSKTKTKTKPKTKGGTKPKPKARVKRGQRTSA